MLSFALHVVDMAPRRALVALILLLVGGMESAWGQSAPDVSVSAEARPPEVGTEGTVAFRIEVRGAPRSVIETPDPPATTNLVLQETTPTTERDVSFDQGQLTRRIVFEWRYRPMRVGTGRIQGTTLRVRGESYTTDEVRVRVVPQSQRPRRPPQARAAPGPPSGADDATRRAGLEPRDLFIRATASADTAYQNEQVTAEYRLFFRPGVRLRQSRMADAWDAPGFWREELDVASRPTPRAQEMYGRTYKAIVLKRVALFPTQTGHLEVDPLRIETEARARPRLGRRDGTVPRSHYEPVTLASEQLALAARPLPPGGPPPFDGAVGQFELAAEVRPDSGAVGEGIELVARIRGTGNIATVSPPVVEAPSEVTVYEPVVETEIDRSGDEIRGTKTFTYTLVPRSSGRHALPPVRFAYFDPVAEQYETVRAALPAVRATGEAAPRARSQTGEGLPVGDIAGPIEQPGRWVRADRRPLYARPWPYAALLVLIVLAAGAVAYRRRRTEASAPAEDEEALDAARPAFEAARHHLRNDERRPFYRAVERGVLAFLDARLDLPRAASGMTGEALDRRLAARGAARTDRECLREVLTDCSEAQFTPAAPAPAAMKETLDRAETLLQRLDATL